MTPTQIILPDITAALRDIGYSPAAAARACRRHYEVVRWFHDDCTAGEIANIIDQHERGNLEVEEKE